MEESLKKFNLRATEDRMALLLDCDVTINELDSLIVDIRKEFETLGIKDPPDEKQLKEKLRHASEENPHLVEFVLIEGKPPAPPQDGHVDWAGDFFNTAFLVDKKTGKIDYWQRAAHESVTKGTLLCRQLPVKEGKDGQDAFGKLLPAEKPVKYYPKVGKNVRLNTHDNACYAEKNGRVRLINNILSVDEVYVIQEDVSLETGNISHTGAVVVNRDILNGAKVEAVGSIEVRGVIEGADILTEGNLSVHGGIRQSKNQKIVVEGYIHAKFLHGGDIQANEDIVVETEIINSTVKTLGAVTISKGHIIGREITALRGIFAGQVGSKAGIPTVLIAGENFSVRNKLSLKKTRIKKIEEELEKLEHTVNTVMSDPESLSTLGQDGYTAMLADISELESDLNNQIEEMKNIRAKAEIKAKKLIEVEETLYPKTILCLDNKRLTVEEEYSGPIKVEIKEGEIKLYSKSSGVLDTKRIEKNDTPN